MDRQVLMQGISFQQPTQVSSGPALKPLSRPEVLPTRKAQQHVFHLPVLSSNCAMLHRLLHHLFLRSTYSKPAGIVQSSAVLTSSVPYTTQRYRKRKLDEERAGLKERKYERKAVGFQCKRCGKDRQSEGHEQYFGNIFCRATSSISFEEWKANLVTKNYGKKK